MRREVFVIGNTGKYRNGLIKTNNMNLIPFKFFKGKVYTDEYTIPIGISHRHWNMLPQDLRRGSELNMLLYIQGWEDARSNNTLNPYDNETHMRMWNRGFTDFQRRIR